MIIAHCHPSLSIQSRNYNKKTSKIYGKTKIKPKIVDRRLQLDKSHQTEYQFSYLPNKEGGSTSRTERLDEACEALDSVLWVHLSLLLSFGMSKGKSLRSTLVALPEVVASCCMRSRLLLSFGISKGRSESSGSLSTKLILSSWSFRG